MSKYDIETIAREIIYNGLFSEYLPDNFNLDMPNFDIFTIPLKNTNDYIEPYKYTMSRFDGEGKRRIIYLPEVTAYISLMNFMKKNSVISELVTICEQNGINSFSKIIGDDGTILKHEQHYGENPVNSTLFETSSSKSQFIKNITSKVKKAQGAKGILHIDISNYFGSIYTHLMPSLFLGYQDAMLKYKDCSLRDESYRKYADFDKYIRQLNGNRTNGILTGPFVSKLIGEALLTTIDTELILSNINFTRYMDDYEIYIYDESEIEKTTNIVANILGKYYLTINHQKDKYVKFPYYNVKNLDQLIQLHKEYRTNEYELMELFTTFFELEEAGVKGAIRYLMKYLESEEKKELNSTTTSSKEKDLFIAYLLNVLSNDSRSLIKTCELLLLEKDLVVKNQRVKDVVEQLLISNINNKNHLEVVWLLYLIKGIGIKTLNEDIAKKIIYSQNELAIIILINEFEEEIYKSYKSEYISSAQSWILLYELYLKNEIGDNEFISRLGLKHNINFYKKLKYNNFSFYKKL